MDLDLADYQELTVKTFRDFFARHSTADTVRAAAEAGGFDRGLWRRLVDTGAAALSVPEAAGGGGGNLVDAALVGFEAGRRIAPIPYSESVVALRLLAKATDQVSLLDWGDLTVYGWRVFASGHSDGAISGGVRWLRGGAAARYCVLPLDGRFALIDLESSGVRRIPHANLGRLPLASIQLRQVVPDFSFKLPIGSATRAASELNLLYAAELTGAGRQALDLSLEHVRDRRQFDRPIGSFQAIQHRLADRVTALDAAELLVVRAASYEQEPAMLRYYSTIALLHAAEAAEMAAKESLQFFGGYGFMVEYDIHLYLRFAKALGVLARHPELVEDALPLRLHATTD